MAIELRDYQVKGIESARNLVRKGNRRILLVCPTGGGKTIVAARIILSCYEQGKRCIFFAHRRELIKQTVAKLIEAGVPCWQVGMLLGSESRMVEAPVVVASIATWVRREHKDRDLVFIDEAHHALADSYKKVYERYKSAVFVGLTATPYRANGDGLGEAFDALEVVTTPRELIDAGHLCNFKVFAGPERADLAQIRTVAGEYDQAQLGVAMDKQKITHGIVQNWQRLASGKPTICFATNVAHSKHIVDAFSEAGARAEHVDDSTDKETRDGAFKRLASGETQILSNVGICTEGTDIPAAKGCILARPTKSLGLYLQMVGRVLRPYSGQTATILDHADNVRKHGFPDVDRVFTLDKKPKVKTDAVMAKECENCGAMVPLAARECPECGWMFPVNLKDQIDPRKDGVLVEVERPLAAKDGPCSPKQAAVLRRAGLRSDVTMKEAGWIIGQLIANRWRAPPAVVAKYRA